MFPNLAKNSTKGFESWIVRVIKINERNEKHFAIIFLDPAENRRPETRRRRGGVAQISSRKLCVTESVLAILGGVIRR